MAAGRTLYQIFVSSTFRDLHVERGEVSWAILKTRNTPAGMEAFPATDDRGWKTIQRTIDDSDYYVLLLGHRYGTVDPSTQMSWTEKEYRYARERGIPVLAFLRDLSETPGDQVESDPELRKKLNDFRALVEAAHLVKGWKRKDDLVALVSQALPVAIQDSIDDGQPRPGWIRGSSATMKIAEELAALSDENRRLREENAALRAAGDTARIEHQPALLFLAGGSSRGPDVVKYSLYVQNVGASGFIIDRVVWLWRLAGGPIIRLDKPVDRGNPHFVPPGARSRELRFELSRHQLQDAAGRRVANASSETDALHITAHISAISKPYDIEVTRPFVLIGDGIGLPAAATPTPEPDGG